MLQNKAGESLALGKNLCQKGSSKFKRISIMINFSNHYIHTMQIQAVWHKCRAAVKTGDINLIQSDRKN